MTVLCTSMLGGLRYGHVEIDSKGRLCVTGLPELDNASSVVVERYCEDVEAEYIGCVSFPDSGPINPYNESHDLVRIMKNLTAGSELLEEARKKFDKAQHS